MSKAKKVGGKNKFHLEFKNSSQKLAWNAFQQHDVLFLVGPAGCVLGDTKIKVRKISDDKKHPIIHI